MNYFKCRGYDEKRLLRSAKEIRQISREDILENPGRSGNKDGRVFVCDWHPGLAHTTSWNNQKASQHLAK